MKRVIIASLALVLTGCGGSSEPKETETKPVVDANEATEKETAEVVSAEIVSANVEKEFGADAFKLSWQTEPAGAPVRIEVSSDPDFKSGEGSQVGEFTDLQDIMWAVEDAAQRNYFMFIPENGKPVKAAARLLPLEGGRNFRDLGGYETSDGRRVKWGRVFRSGVMHELTDADYDYLKQLGIRTVCDYRTAEERTNEPTDWRAGAIDYQFFPDPASSENPAENPMFAALMNPDSTPDDVQAGMAAQYSDIAYEQAPAYTAMFDELAKGNIPLAFNCSAGKDRAGTSAALILTALGVPREQVVHDYSLSDDYVDYMAAFMNEEARKEAEEGNSPYAFLFELPDDKVAPLMASHPEYIEATFADLEAEHGSVMAFIQNELDVTDDELVSIRAQLLE